jgi:hypothetical protein
VYKRELKALRANLKALRAANEDNNETASIYYPRSRLAFTAVPLSQLPPRVNIFGREDLRVEVGSESLYLYISSKRVTFFNSPFYTPLPLTFEGFCPKCLHSTAPPRNPAGRIGWKQDTHVCPTDSEPSRRGEVLPDPPLLLPPGFFCFEATHAWSEEYSDESIVTRGVWCLEKVSGSEIHLKVMYRHRYQTWYGRFLDMNTGRGITSAKPVAQTPFRIRLTRDGNSKWKIAHTERPLFDER